MVAAPCTPVALSGADSVPAPVPIDTVPLRAVVLVGENRTVIVHDELVARDVPQVVLAKAKSVPETVGAASDNVPIPVLVTVAVAVLDAPTPVVGNEGVDSVPEGAWPVPDNDT